MSQILSDISIIPYSPEYREGCMAAFVSNTPKYFTHQEIDQFREWLDYIEGISIDLYPGEENRYFVVLQGQQVIGCGGFGYNPSTKKATLAWGLVHNDHHKQYVGSALLTHRLNRIGALFPQATVLLDTTQHAYAFFERHGFEVEKITNDAYAPGMHRYDMKWQKR